MIRIAFILLSLFAITAFGQTRLEGTITADIESVKLGQITIYSATDSTLKKGTYLDSTWFSMLMDAGDESDFYAKISVPNYLDTLVSFQVNDTVVNLGIIPMIKNTDLEKVDVMYRKEMFKRTMDGIKVNVEGTNLQTLTNLFEVLKASPKITSPDDERIEIIGRGSPLILVDRQAIISNDELKAIPASQIERIEIITNPSAKYKAQGSGSGVIEVYTKSFHLEGYNLTIRGEGGINTQLRPSSSLNLGLSMKKKKFSLNGYLGANYNENNSFGNGEGVTTDSSDRKMLSNYENLNRYLWQYYSVKAAYNFTESQRLTFGVNGHGSNGSYDGVSTSLYTEGSDELIRDFSSSSSKWTWLNNSAFVNYLIETDTNESNLEINLNYVNRVSTNDGLSRTEYENVPTETFSSFDIRNDSRDIPHIGELRVNYEHIFDTTGWELNVGGSYSALMNQKRFDRYNGVDGDWVIDPPFSNSYDYQEHIGAAFLEVQKNWDKFGFRAGIRTEYTRLDGYSNTLEQQFMDSSYFLPFPTASIMYQPSDKVALTLFYDSGIDRPQFSNYDPFIRVEDSLSISYGNPFLRPELEKSIGLDVDLFYAYNFSVVYSYYTDPISTISFIDEETFLRESTPWNAQSDHSLSASLSIPIQTKWLQGWNSIWVDYSKYTFTPIFGREPFFNLTYGVYSYLTFTLPRDFNIMNRFSLSKWGWDDTENNAQANWGLRLTKKYKGGNFQIFGEVGNIIPPRAKRTTYSGNFVYTSDSQNQFTTFKAGFFLKVGRLKANAHIEESSSGQSDRL